MIERKKNGGIRRMKEELIQSFRKEEKGERRERKENND